MTPSSGRTLNLPVLAPSRSPARYRSISFSMRASMCWSECPSIRITSRTICRSVLPSYRYDGFPGEPKTSPSARCIAARPMPPELRSVPSMSKRTSLMRA